MAQKKKKMLPSSSIVTQANELVSARYALPLAEQRLVLTMIARIQPDDEDFKEYRISVSELAEFIGVAKGSAYIECKKITKSLLTRVLEIHEPGRLLQANWVSSADYIDGEGCVMLCFDPKLKPYLLQLKGNFTSCKLEMMLSFKSQYTMRMYSLLKQYERLKKREIEVDELRDMLGLRIDQHREYKNFKTNILLPTQKELVEKADLTFTFEEIKYGRRVGAIRFQIVVKQRAESLTNETLIPLISDLPLPVVQEIILSTPHLPIQKAQKAALLDKLLDFVPEQHRAKKTVQTALTAFEKKHGFEYVRRNILYCNAKAAKSYAGFLINTLKEDWGHEWELEQQAPVSKKLLELWERNGFSSEKEYNDAMFRRQMEKYGKLEECRVV